jgi:YidC/Oxa1 family membrane protein insertase
MSGTSVLTPFTAVLTPLFGASATAAAIVVLTVLVRLALHPLARAAASGEEARAELAPRVAELNRKHSGDPERLRRALAELHADAGVSPLAGCLPSLLQLPVFFLMYRLFSTGAGGGGLLGSRWADALAHDGGVLGPWGTAFLALFAVIAAVVPLAVGLYLATSTTWTAAERAWLRRPPREQGLAGRAG